MKTSMSVKVEPEVRDQARMVFEKMGLDMSTAINIFLLASIREKGLPFELSTKPLKITEDDALFMLINDLKQAEKEEQRGEIISLDDFKAEMKNKYGF